MTKGLIEDKLESGNREVHQSHSQKEESEKGEP